MSDDGDPDREYERDTGRPERDDPRLEGRYRRAHRTDDGRGDVVLVGVVHDHPASVYRAEVTVARERPDVLALELAPAAVPLFEHYAADASDSLDLGGEMSAAVRAATTARVVGIDGPSTGFLRHLLGELRSEGASLSTVRSTARRVASITATAIRCRLAASFGDLVGRPTSVYSSVSHQATREDDPRQQAADERTQVRRAASVMDAFERGPASRVCNEARERHMAARLSELRADGDVVAVVGFGHLEAVSGRLDSD